MNRPEGRPQGLPEGMPRRRQWVTALGIVLAVRVLFVLIAWGAAWWLADGTGRLEVGLLDPWRIWDADFFVKIADHGYAGPGVDAHAEAFFPLLPLLIRGLMALGLGGLGAGMLVSLVSSWVAVAYLLRLGDEVAGEGAGHRAALYLVFFPTAVFLVAGYSEALFLAGAIPAWHHARRGEWWFVAPFAAVAVGARLAGLFVLLGLAVFALQQRDRWLPAAGALAVAALPAVAYALWLWSTRGDPLFFVEAQRAGWGRELVGPIDALRATWSTYRSDLPTTFIAAWRVEIVAAGAGVVGVVWAGVRRDWPAVAMLAPFWALLLSSSWYYSLPRLLLTFFPVLLYVAEWTGTGRRHETVLLTIAPLATFGVIMFTQGVWFF